MNLRARLRGSRSRLAFWVLAAVSLAISHDAVFFAQTGPGQALLATLRQGGHEYWAFVSIGLAALGLVVGVGSLLRLRRLRRWAASLGQRGGPMQASIYLARVAGVWARHFPLVVLGFLVQENAEHLVAHGHLIGLVALGGAEYPLAVPVIGAISLLAALIAGAFSVTERELIIRITAALRAALARAPRLLVLRPTAVLRWSTIPVIARAGAGRAPPLLLASPA
jgi:hypothetical protein